jgi:hypothetical protein
LEKVKKVMDDWERDLRPNRIDRTDESWIVIEDSALLNEGVFIDMDGCRAAGANVGSQIGIDPNDQSDQIETVFPCGRNAQSLI